MKLMDFTFLKLFVCLKTPAIFKLRMTYKEILHVAVASSLGLLPRVYSCWYATVPCTNRAKVPCLYFSSTVSSRCF